MKWITEVMQEQASNEHKDYIKNLNIKKMERRNRIDLMTPAEKAIYDAMQEVEKMSADVRLTDAVILLGQAKDKVADFVDGITDNI